MSKEATCNLLQLIDPIKKCRATLARYPTSQNLPQIQIFTWNVNKLKYSESNKICLKPESRVELSLRACPPFFRNSWVFRAFSCQHYTKPTLALPEEMESFQAVALGAPLVAISHYPFPSLGATMKAHAKVFLKASWGFLSLSRISIGLRFESENWEPLSAFRYFWRDFLC